ncbi:MAG: hypothetical protein ACM3O9_09775 [Methylocystaceae bacterium]
MKQDDIYAQVELQGQELPGESWSTLQKKYGTLDVFIRTCDEALASDQ